MPSNLQRSADRSRRDGAKIVKDLQGAFAAQPGGHQSRLGGVVASTPERYSRDFQRAKVYDAERMLRRILSAQVEHPLVSVCGSTIAVPLERVFGNIPAVQQYCTDALNRCWPAYEQAVRAGVRVRARKGEGEAHYEQGGVIAVPVTGSRWALRAMPVLHELAHHLAGHGQAHGPEFIQAYLYLLGQEMGPEMALLALCTFGEMGVKM